MSLDDVLLTLNDVLVQVVHVGLQVLDLEKLDRFVNKIFDYLSL
jgi:hypothetical protein